MAQSPKTKPIHPENGRKSEIFSDEYQRQKSLFEAQTPIVQRFLEIQARQVAESFTSRAQRLRFTLPDRVTVLENMELLPVLEKMRLQVVGNFQDRMMQRDVWHTLRNRLAELETSPDKAVTTGARLIRYASAQHIIHNMLPAGRTVSYIAEERDEIPSIPIMGVQPGSAITAETDAIVEEGNPDRARGGLQVPYVPAARSFFLPQWVAFDENGELLVNSIDEAEAHIASMQKFLEILFASRSLAPYVVADNEFESKRYGMLGQLVNQGRALALYKTRKIIEGIKRRADNQSLNRGLSLSMPFFDDQDLRIESHSFVVIPAGRIMFVPAFVVRAAQEEQVKIAQDTRLNPSTRRHLLKELSLLEIAFKPNNS